jgi:hypothetical protein
MGTQVLQPLGAGDHFPDIHRLPGQHGNQEVVLHRTSGIRVIISAYRIENISEVTVSLEVHHVRKLADLNNPGRRDKPAWMP